MTAVERTWLWISILGSGSATEATENLRDSGVSEAGAKQLLRYFEDSVNADNLAGMQRFLSLCERSIELGTPEALAKEFERQDLESDRRRLSIIEGVGRVVDEGDLEGFHTSMENHLGPAGKVPSDLPGKLRAGQMEPADILRRACESADAFQKRALYQSNST